MSRPHFWIDQLDRKASFSRTNAPVALADGTASYEPHLASGDRSCVRAAECLLTRAMLSRLVSSDTRELLDIVFVVRMVHGAEAARVLTCCSTAAWSGLRLNCYHVATARFGCLSTGPKQ